MRISSRDVRIAARSLLRHRGFSVVAVLSLALAIALNTTMYSVLDAMINPAVDLRSPEQLFGLMIWGDNRHKVDNATRAALLRAGFHSYEGASYRGVAYGTEAAVEYRERFAQVTFATVAPNYFALLGVHPLAGRVFTEADASSTDQPIVVSERLAGTLFPDGTTPIGASVDVNGVKHPIIGVLGRASTLPGATEALWMLPPPSVSLSSLPMNIVRFRDGAQHQNAQRDLALIATRLASLAGETPRYVRVQTYSIQTAKFQFASLHYALIAAVIAVLLIACANLANMQLARGIGRSRELALRAALGASRGDIVRHLVLESAILAAAGVTLGLLLAFWGTHFLSARIPPAVAEYVIAPQTSWRVFAFAVLAGLFCVFLVGLLPAIRVSRVDPSELLKSGAGTGAHRRSRRQYGGMVILEMGLSLALLCGAAIVVRTAIKYRTMRVGFDVTPLATAWLRAESDRSPVVHYTEAQSDILARALRIPGVADATVAFHAGARHHAVTVLLAGGVSKQIPAPLYGYAVVTPSYLRTFGIPIVEGRDFTDGLSGKPEVIVDQTTARFLWPGGSAVGRAIKLGDDTSSAPWATVIGVAKTLQRSSWSLDGIMTRLPNRLGALYYRPSERDSMSAPARGYTVDVTVRTKGDATRLPIALRRQFMSSPPYQLLTAQSMDEKLGLLFDRQRHDFVATTFMLFALLALGLAALGIYGIISHSVAERTREIGVRIALGATARDVLHAVLREGNAIALGGVALGLVCTRMTVGWLRAFSFPEDQYDATLFASMGIVLFAVALVSALWPALRATRIDPVLSLRSE